MHYFTDVLKKYATFTGRARRSEYWYYTLFYFIIFVVLAAVGYLLDNATGDGVFLWYRTLTGLFSLALLLPSLAVAVRRLHDTGRSGWYYFLVLIPVVGGIILLVFFCQDSVGDNEYGPNPKAVAA